MALGKNNFINVQALAEAFEEYSKSRDLVHKTGDREEQITGTKVFTSEPVLPQKTQLPNSEANASSPVTEAQLQKVIGMAQDQVSASQGGTFDSQVTFNDGVYFNSSVYLGSDATDLINFRGRLNDKPLLYTAPGRELGDSDLTFATEWQVSTALKKHLGDIGNLYVSLNGDDFVYGRKTFQSEILIPVKEEPAKLENNRKPATETQVAKVQESIKNKLDTKTQDIQVITGQVNFASHTIFGTNSQDTVRFYSSIDGDLKLRNPKDGELELNKFAYASEYQVKAFQESVENKYLNKNTGGTVTGNVIIDSGTLNVRGPVELGQALTDKITITGSINDVELFSAKVITLGDNPKKYASEAQVYRALLGDSINHLSPTGYQWAVVEPNQIAGTDGTGSQFAYSVVKTVNSASDDGQIPTAKAVDLAIKENATNAVEYKGNATYFGHKDLFDGKEGAQDGERALCYDGQDNNGKPWLGVRISNGSTADVWEWKHLKGIKNGNLYYIDTIVDGQSINNGPTGIAIWQGQEKRWALQKGKQLELDNETVALNSDGKVAVQKLPNGFKLNDKNFNGEGFVDFGNVVQKDLTPNHVYGTDAEGNPTMYDKTAFSTIKDIRINGVSVVDPQTGIANIEIDTRFEVVSEDWEA